MADEGIKDFIITWVSGGLLLFCLLAFAISFTYNNNQDALNDGTGDIFNEQYTTFSNRLISVNNTNNLLNITANTNPEVSDLGSRDSVAVSFEATGSARYYWDVSKKLIAWVFAGTAGQIILGVVGGIIVFLTVFYIWKFIKNGL